MGFNNTEEYAIEQDKQDGLARFRNEFYIKR